jgi:uncharacterized protein (DUF2141 family)
MKPAFFLCLAFVLASTAQADPARVTISGRVDGTSGKSPVYIALWQSDGFLERPVRQVRIEAGAVPDFSFAVAPGRWVVSAFEDRNQNGVLDMGLFGPKEPTGFWRPFTGWRKPKFEDVAMLVSRDIRDAKIPLK